MKIIKYGSGGCGPCGRMSKFDDRVVREEGLDFVYLRKGSTEYKIDPYKEQLGYTPSNPQYVLVEDGIVKGTFKGATDPGTFRQRIRTLLEEKDGACCTSDDRSGNGKNCEHDQNNWVKDDYDSGGDTYRGTTHMVNGKLGGNLSKDHVRGKRISCGMTGGNSGCTVTYQICDKEDDKPDDECEKDGDCGDCEECRDGKCRDKCKDDEKCENGKCVDKNPSPSPEPTPDPDECKNHDDCPDKCCDGVCQECCQNSHCVGGQCIDGVCVDNEKPDPDPDPELPPPPPPIDNGDGYDGPCPTTTINLFWDKKTNKYGAVYDDSKISDIAFVNAFDDEKRSLIITYKPYTCIPTCEDIGLCSTYTASGNTIVEFDGVTCEVNEEKRTLTLTFNGAWIDPDNWGDPDEGSAEPVSRWQQPVVYKDGGNLGGDPSGHCIDFDERECVPFRWDCKPENHTICQPEGNEKVEYTYKVSTHGCNARCGDNGGGTQLKYEFYDEEGKKLTQESGAGGNFKFTIDKDTPIGRHNFSVTATCSDYPDPNNRVKEQNFWIKVEDCNKPPEPTPEPEPAPEPPSGAFYPQCFYLVCCPDCPPTPPAFEEGDNGDCDNRPEPDEVPGTNTRAKVYLYDRLNHTFIFCCPIKTDVTWLLPFDTIPPVFQRYITTMASVRAAAQMVDNPQLFQLLKDRENTLRMECMNYELEQGDLNYLGQPDYTTYVGYQPIQTLNR